MIATSSSFAGVVGQDHAVDRLHQLIVDPVHAYLFIGPAGCTKEIAARAFAAMLISGSEDPTNNDVRLVLAGYHPDVIEIRREGASLSREQADEIIRNASLSPIQASSKVIIVEDLHLARPDTVARLLKTIEEPPAGTYFVLLADLMDPVLVTIASRCVRVEFNPLETDDLTSVLVTSGIDRDTAAFAAASSAGDLRRAKLLASDPGLRHRREAFARVPSEVNGTGAAVARLVTHLLSLIAEAAKPMEQRHVDEIAELERQQTEFGVRGGKKALQDEQKRELRRHRADELKAGLAAIASTYRDAIVATPNSPSNNAYITAIHAIHKAIGVIDLNVNETLLLQALFLKLPQLNA